MKLTCVTAVFNVIKSGNRENLIRCVRSVAALKTEHEHLIYDGGSTDGTVELLRELEREYGKCLNVGIGECLNGGESGKCLNVGIGECLNQKGGSLRNSNIQTFSNSNISSSINLQPQHSLRVVSEPDTGIYNALNKGVRDAQGEWFYVLGCDDYICAPEVMDKYLQEVADGTQVIAAAMLHECPSDRAGNRVYQMFTKKSDLRIILCDVPVGHQGEIVRTALVREFGGFDECYKIAADVDMLLKAHDQAVKFQYEFIPFAYFATAGISNTARAASQKELHDVMAKHFNVHSLQRNCWDRHRLLPFGIVVRYLFHRDLAYRISARWMIWRHFKPAVRYVLYPLVVLTRSLRHKRILEI